MKYEANLVASEVSLPTDDILELIERDYNIQQIRRWFVKQYSVDFQGWHGFWAMPFPVSSMHPRG